jgi:hypothetical protein
MREHNSTQSKTSDSSYIHDYESIPEPSKKSSNQKALLLGRVLTFWFLFYETIVDTPSSQEHTWQWLFGMTLFFLFLSFTVVIRTVRHQALAIIPSTMELARWAKRTCSVHVICSSSSFQDQHTFSFSFLSLSNIDPHDFLTCLHFHCHFSYVHRQTQSDLIFGKYTDGIPHFVRIVILLVFTEQMRLWKQSQILFQIDSHHETWFLSIIMHSQDRRFSYVYCQLRNISIL